MNGAMPTLLDLVSRTGVSGVKKKGGWIKKDLGDRIEEGQSKVIQEKRHVAIVQPDSAGAIDAPLSHVGVRVESRAAKRYGKRG